MTAILPLILLTALTGAPADVPAETCGAALDAPETVTWAKHQGFKVSQSSGNGVIECPAVNPFCGGGCTGVGNETVTDTGEQVCQIPGQAEINCGPGKTIHIINESCRACCNDNPPCLCQGTPDCSEDKQTFDCR